MEYQRIDTMNNAGFQTARAAAGLAACACTTSATRSASACATPAFPEEDRPLLLGHASRWHAAALRHRDDRAPGRRGQRGEHHAIAGR